MSDNLLYSLSNGEIELGKFQKWLLSQEEKTDYNCTQNEFLIYFLNFIHEEIADQKKFNEPALNCTPRKLKLKHDVNSISKRDNKDNKSSSMVKVLEKKFSCDTPLGKDLADTTPRHPKSPICLGDFLVTKSAKKKTPLRKSSNKRITPTSIKDSFKTTNSYTEFDTKEVIQDGEENRRFLAQERLKIASRQVPAVVKSKNEEEPIEIQPSLRLVLNQNQLDILIKIYSSILKHNLVLNIIGEIHYLVSLLVMKQYDSTSIDDGIQVLDLNDENILLTNCKVSSCLDYFNSIHNLVYFSVEMLKTQFHVLEYYDKSTIKLLSSNKRLEEFSPEFSRKLRKLCEKKSDYVREYTENSNVRFDLEVDTRSNFITDDSFLAFKKQRDLFYEILRSWEKEHLLPEWRFQVQLGAKIRSLLYMQNEVCDTVHFARLFKLHLLNTCDQFIEDKLPSTFPTIDPNKLSKLQNRLINKQSDISNSLPDFPGYQQFYKEFIITAGNHSFNIHLCDGLICEISESIHADVSHEKTYLNRMRVSAKFLGFIESIPYNRLTHSYDETRASKLISIREKKNPPLDVKKILSECNSIVLTIPWLVNYLSMLDYVTLRLPYYLSVYKMLYRIYHSYGEWSTTVDYDAALVRFCLGWLFELPHFPNTDYGLFRDKFAVDRKGSLRAKKPSVVDECILFTCCPHLEDMKKMLVSNRGVTVKHITPVTAVESSEMISKKRCEQQLEEAFFNNQPESVKKTVEFVSERVSSTCIKHICNTIVPSCKKTAFNEFRDFVNSQLTYGTSMDVVKIKTRHLAHEKLAALQSKCKEELSIMLGDRIPKSFDSLLPVDSLPQVKLTCVSITTKNCKERIHKWTNDQLTINIFSKDIDKCFDVIKRKPADEKPVFVLPPSGKRPQHDDSLSSGFRIADKIRTLSVDVLERKDYIDGNLLDVLLKDVKESLEQRCDLNDFIVFNISNLMFELALLLIAFRPDLMDRKTQAKLIDIWRRHCRSTEDLFKDLLCPRNVALLGESPNPGDCWRNYARFVAFLIEEKVLSCDSFERQCTGFFRRDYERSIINGVCSFMNQFVEFYKTNGGDCGKFTMLVEFLSEFCMDL
ncbi:unnamed protein product [Phyllotreta striolata]|uniref:Codanin-1 C-terminal domain-containing protein n=1 Tax=Phyllotreta striolata TaxID=444603 RepID=A0A9N9TM45_PHYSR|nr:unnamed protein product [Phyllotreta striolata]